MRYIGLFVAIFVLGFVSSAQAASEVAPPAQSLGESSFAVYYGSYAPLPTCEQTPNDMLEAKTPRDEMEVQYLYGRNVLGYHDDMETPEAVINSNNTPGSLPYGWSLRAEALQESFN